MKTPQRLEPADQRHHPRVLDRLTQHWITLEDFVGSGDYGSVIEGKRVGLKLERHDGELRYGCPHCEQAMVLASHAIRERTVQRFYFKHEDENSPCVGERGLSEAAICARRFGHCKEGALHRQFKAWLKESMDSDPAFSEVDPETRWKDIDGVHWRQPDVQCIWGDQRCAFEAQLSTTFLHVITQRMRFYERNHGRLLWLFRELDPTHFRMAEDDIFYSNNRNAFRVTHETVLLSKAQCRFALECLWFEPVDIEGNIVDETRCQIVFFDQLRFDVSHTGVPRTFFFDYDAVIDQIALARRQAREAATRLAAQADRERRKAADNALRYEMEALFVDFPAQSDEVQRRWSLLCPRLARVHAALPEAFTDDSGPFYLLMAAYSAKRGHVVGCKLKNFAELENNLFGRHKDALWVFRVMSKHYGRTRAMQAQGDPAKWQNRRATYLPAWKAGDPKYAPNRRFDGLLDFLLPDAPPTLWQDPADAF